MMLKLLSFFIIVVGMILISFMGLADENSLITLGTEKIIRNNRIWFGDQVLWRVLKKKNGNALLISNSILGLGIFNEDGKSNEWEGSLAQNWCFLYYINWPEGFEKEAILPTSIAEKNEKREKGISYTYKGGHDKKYYYGAASLEDEFFFFLSGQEADELFESDDDRMITNATKNTWWLRSPSKQAKKRDGNQTGVIDKDGWVIDGITYLKHGIRPAFNLDLSTVLFTHELQYSEVSYRLTMMDRELKIELQDGKKAYRNGNLVTIPYNVSGPYALDDTKVYALVTDNNRGSKATVNQYTELTHDSETNTGTFILDSGINGIWGKDFHIYLLAVNENAGWRTDFASAPIEIKP